MQRQFVSVNPARTAGAEEPELTIVTYNILVRFLVHLKVSMQHPIYCCCKFALQSRMHHACSKMMTYNMNMFPAG